MITRATVLSSMCLFLLATACERRKDSAPTAPAAAPVTPTAADGPRSENKTPAVALPWIHDDYAKAQRQAAASGKPILIDMWAAWCHTCISMQHTVLTDSALADLVDRFVWLAVDTEAQVNAPLLAKLPVNVWPTFYVVSPDDLSIQARQLGSTSAREFAAFLLQGEKGHLASLDASGKLKVGSPLWHLRAADRAAGRGDDRAAAESYAASLAAAPADWPRRTEILVAQIAALWRSEQKEQCAQLAIVEIDNAARALNAATADFAYWANKCSASLRDPQMQTKLRANAMLAVESVLASDEAELSTDDRSEALRILRTLALDNQDPEAAQQYALRQRVLLDRAVAEAKTGLEQLTFVYHRTALYAELGIGDEIVPWLNELTRAMPDQYDPPYRLASLHLKMGNPAKALAAATTALDRVYGPRKARVQLLLAKIHDARGQTDDALAARLGALKTLEALPAAQRSEKLEKTVRDQLAVGRRAL